MTSTLGGLAMKRRLLLLYLTATVLLIGAGVVRFAAQARSTGIVTSPLAAACALGALALGLSVLALRALRRASPQELEFIGARYLRLVFALKLLAFLIVLFGTRKEAFARFAAHLFGAMALHRTALLWPGRLTAALRAISRTRLLRNAELVLFNLALTLVLADSALRAYYASAGQGFFSAQQAFAGKLRNDLFGTPPNSLGYNDDEFQREKRPGVTRIAAIGDSFFVAEAPRSLGFIQRAEALLAQQAPTPAEVYNFGIIGNDIGEYHAVLEQEALSFRPDLVLVGVYVGNDIRIATPSTVLDRHSSGIYRAINGIRYVLEAKRLERSGEFTDVTKNRVPASGTLSAQPITTRARYLQSVRSDLDFLAVVGSANVEQAWWDSLAGLSRIKALCDQRGIPLLIVLSPAHVQVSRELLEEATRVYGLAIEDFDAELPQKRLLAFLEAEHVPTLDLLPAFRRAAPESDPDDFYLVNDNHWSIAGNEIAARELSRFLATFLGT